LTSSTTSTKHSGQVLLVTTTHKTMSFFQQGEYTFDNLLKIYQSVDVGQSCLVADGRQMNPCPAIVQKKSQNSLGYFIKIQWESTRETKLLWDVDLFLIERPSDSNHGTRLPQRRTRGVIDRFSPVNLQPAARTTTQQQEPSTVNDNYSVSEEEHEHSYDPTHLYEYSQIQDELGYLRKPLKMDKAISLMEENTFVVKYREAKKKWKHCNPTCIICGRSGRAADRGKKNPCRGNYNCAHWTCENCVVKTFHIFGAQGARCGLCTRSPWPTGYFKILSQKEWRVAKNIAEQSSK